MRRTSGCAMLLLLCAVGFCPFAIPCAAQDWTPVGRGDAAPAKAADLLTLRHIGLTKDALLGALHNDSSEIRGLAAAQLADEGATDAIPAIVAALEAEQAPMQKLNIAASLAQLGDERGIRALHQACYDTHLSMSDRLTAVSDLLFWHDESCWNVVAQAAQSHDVTDRITAFSLFPSFEKLSTDQSAAFRAQVINAAHDDDSSVRMEAINTLDRIGDVNDAIPALEAAIVAEPSPVMRMMMENELRGLKKKQQ